MSEAWLTIIGSFRPRYEIRAKRDRGRSSSPVSPARNTSQISSTPRASTPSSAASPCKRAYLFAQARVGFRQGVDVPLLDVGGLDAGPLRAGEQGVPGRPGQQVRRVEGVCRYEQLRAHTR